MRPADAIRRTVFLSVAVALLALATAGSVVAQDDVAANLDVPRKLTLSELQIEIAVLQREFEELIVRIGGKDPTDEQSKKMHDLSVKLIDLQDQRDKLEAENKEKAAIATGFKARWLRLVGAVRDITNWDVNDGMFRIRLGIRFQIDGTAGWEDQALADAVGEIPESLEFRRFRIFAVGRLFRTLDFKFQYDFAVDLGPKDAFLEGSKYVKYFKWRVGQFKEPFSLDRQNSSSNLGFLEWGLPVQALAPGRNIGIMLRHNESMTRLTWAASMTTGGRTTDDNRATSNFMLTGRVTGLPMYRDDGRRLVHLGLGYSSRKPSGGTQTYFARPEARFAPTFLDTGELDANTTQLFGFEAATVQGPWWLQGEYIRSRSSSDELGNLDFGGWYAEAGYFLTGESRFYRTHNGTFGRLTPNRLFHGGNPFKRRGDCGALEFTARLSTLDLNSGPITAGEMRDVSVGINWYMSQTMRVATNYIHASIRDVGSANIFVVRLQFNP